MVTTDFRIIFAIVGALGVIAFASTGGLIALALMGRPIPAELAMMATTAVGALAGLLGKTSSVPTTPPVQPVEVVNGPGQAVPTAETAGDPDRTLEMPPHQGRENTL